jgi:glycosyltransferase involved in cell wall biosynthesis
VVGIFISKAEESKVQAIVDSVFYSQRERQDFVPIFVTESPSFRPFVAKGYVFEYLPPLDDAVADQEWAHAWRKGRLDLITAKWGISHFVNDLGQIANGHMFSGCRPKVFVYPDYGPVNPYIEMMYRQLREDWDVAFGSAETAAAVAAGQGPVVFHLHWEDAAYRGERRQAIPARMAALLTAIDRLKALGGRFIWTVHNLQPHETADRELHVEFMRELAARADILHVNSPWAAESLIEEYGPDIPVRVIDHPSYAGCYPLAESQEEAAAALGLAVDRGETTFLFLGQIRRYKGLERLLNAAPEFDQARFLIAGRSGRFDPSGSLPANCTRFSGFVVEPRGIEPLTSALRTRRSPS